MKRFESPLTWKKISVTRTDVFARATRASRARARRALPSTRASSERTTTTPTTSSTADDLPTGSLERFLVAHLEFASRALEERSDVSASRRNNDDSERRRRRPTMRPDCSNFNLNRGIPEQLDASDTAPPPLPPWLRGFLVTARKREHAAVAGEEVASLCDDIFLREIDGVGGSREKTPPAGKINARSTRVFAESLLIPGCPGSVFVAIKPDDADVDVVALAEKIIEDVDDDAARADVCWSRTAHAQRIIPVERIAPEYDLERLAREVIAKKFPARGRATDRGPPPTFKVSYEEHSPAEHLHKTETEKMVADLVPDHYDVRLHDPDLTILVIVAGGSAMLAVTRGYDASQKFHKFHVRARDAARKSRHPKHPFAAVHAFAEKHGGFAA